MSKPIKLTDELKNNIISEFTKSVESEKMFNGEISFKKKFEWEDDERASIVFETLAFTKMYALIQDCSDEVAWHGVAKRSTENNSEFIISDIMVYPQEVTSATVDTDQIKYQTWLYSFDDDTFNNIRMQSHSHVNMGTSPSATDLTHQEKILSMCDNNMFYIFMIWNKRMEHTVKIFDLENNTLYEDKDIDILVGDNSFDIKGFLEDSRKLVVKKTYTYNSGNSLYNNNKSKKDNKDSKEKTSDKSNSSEKESKIIQGDSSWKGRAMDRLDDYEDGYENYYQGTNYGYPYDC